MRINYEDSMAFDESDHSEAAAREIAGRPWPPNSMARILTAVRGYVPSAVEFVSTGETAGEIQEDHVRSARYLAETVARPCRVTAIVSPVASNDLPQRYRAAVFR